MHHVTDIDLEWYQFVLQVSGGQLCPSHLTSRAAAKGALAFISCQISSPTMNGTNMFRGTQTPPKHSNMGSISTQEQDVGTLFVSLRPVYSMRMTRSQRSVHR